MQVGLLYQLRNTVGCGCYGELCGKGMDMNRSARDGIQNKTLTAYAQLSLATLTATLSLSQEELAFRNRWLCGAGDRKCRSRTCSDKIWIAWMKTLSLSQWRWTLMIAVCQATLSAGAAELSPNSTWLVTSRLDTIRHVRRVERVETNVLFDKLGTAKMHGLDTANVPSRVDTWRDEPSGIWALSRLLHWSPVRQRVAYRQARSHRLQDTGLDIRAGGSKFLVRYLLRYFRSRARGKDTLSAQCRAYSTLLSTCSPRRKPTLRSSDILLLAVPRMLLALTAKAFSISVPSVSRTHYHFDCRSAQFAGWFRHMLSVKLHP